MRFRIDRALLTFLITTSLGAVAVAGASPAAGGAQASGGGGNSGHFGGAGADLLRFRHLAMSAIRAKLAVEDDEQWKSLWAKIERVLQAQRNARTGASMSMSSGVMVKGTPPPNVVIPSPPAAGAA